MALHKDATLADIHALNAATYADITARDADTAFQVVANVNKLVRVDSPESFYLLISVGPAVWHELSNAVSLQFPTTGSNPAYSEGLLFYDNAEGTLAFFNAESEIELNIGEEHWVRVRNNSGATITDGSVVYISGAISDNPTIALARSDVVATANTIGLATHDIENNTVGYVTILGLVRGLNTAAFAAGDTLYVDATTPGALTNVSPTGTNFSVVVGTVTRSNASDGRVLVRPEQLLPLTSGEFLQLGNIDTTIISSAQWTRLAAIDQGVAIADNVTFNDLVVAGNLTVQGTTVTLDTATLLVEDKNIELGNVTTPTDVTADGGGITLKGDTDKTIIWDNATDSWKSNQNFDITGNLTLTGTVDGIDIADVINGMAARTFETGHIDTNVFVTQLAITLPAPFLAMDVSEDQTKFFTAGNDPKIFQHNMSIPGDVSTAVAAPANTFAAGFSIQAISISPDGLDLITVAGGGTVRFWTMAVPYDFSNAVQGADVSPAEHTTNWLSCTSSPSGHFFYLHDQNGEIHQYSRTGWKDQSLTFVGTFNAGTNSNTQCSTISHDGKILYVNPVNDDLQEYVLTENWKITSAVLIRTNFTFFSNLLTREIVIASDASRLYNGTTEIGNGDVGEYSLGLSSKAFVGTFFNGVALTAAGAATNFLNEAGGYTTPDGLAETLAQTLINGNTTAGNDIVLSIGDKLTTPLGVFMNIVAGGASIVTGDGGRISITAGAGGSTSGDGGDVVLTVGSVTSGTIGKLVLDGHINLLGSGATGDSLITLVTSGVDQWIIHNDVSDGQKLKFGDVPGSIYVLTLSQGGGADIVGNLSVTGDYASDASFNTKIGTGALSAITTGDRNTALGFNALNSVTTGDRNTAIGFDVMTGLQTALHNLGVGTDILQSLTTGPDNIGIGRLVSPVLTTGFNNIGIGSGVLSLLVSGTQNIAIGRDCLIKMVSGIDNVAVGSFALELITGNVNTALGNKAGSLSTSGTNNIFIGENAQASTPTASNEIVLGNSSNTSTRLRGKVKGDTFDGKRTATAVSITTAGESIIGVTSTAAARTITLATADTIDGRIVTIKDESGAAGTNNITIATEASETIDGASTLVISTNYGKATLYSDGTNWFII